MEAGNVNARLEIAGQQQNGVRDINQRRSREIVMKNIYALALRDASMLREIGPELLSLSECKSAYFTIQSSASNSNLQHIVA